MNRAGLSPLPFPFLIQEKDSKIMYNSAAITRVHRSTYRLVDKVFYQAGLIFFQLRHPILAYNLFNPKIPLLPFQDENGRAVVGLSYKRISEKHMIYAFNYSDYPKVYYVDQITPQSARAVQRRMLTFFQTYRELNETGAGSYTRQAPGNTYRSSNR